MYLTFRNNLNWDFNFTENVICIQENIFREKTNLRNHRNQDFFFLCDDLAQLHGPRENILFIALKCTLNPTPFKYKLNTIF